ncbi:MAG: hypothetical protein LBI40_03500 [Treponema sp.]|jgi:hypothetical protein|nr:hypothetical protein [Treponema sp.]
MTEKVKKIMGLFWQMESPRCQDYLIGQAEAMVRAQEALKEDYGLPADQPPRGAA